MDGTHLACSPYHSSRHSAILILSFMRTLIAFALATLPVLACDCMQLTVCEILQRPTLFIGQVVEGGLTLREDPWFASARTVRFKVLTAFRGLPPRAETVDVQIMPSMGLCGPNPFYEGKTYLVVPWSLEGRLTDGMCSSSRDVQASSDDVRQVREYFAGNMRPHIQGKVAAARESSLVDFLLRFNETISLSGARVSASRGAATVSTVTDTLGRYTLPVHGSGEYRIRANLTHYSGVAETVTVPVRGCAVQDLAMRIDNTITGRVFDEHGIPMNNGRVGLVDLDRAPVNPQGHAWFNEAYVESTGAATYTFRNVPIGRYLVMFNPDGPRWDPLTIDQAFESSYYPAGNTKSAARTVEIKSNGNHLTGIDLHTGNPVAPRTVEVRVRFPDGTPMTTARIQCVGAPLSPGEPPWELNGNLTTKQADGKVRFSAPANRVLRLEVSDEYGRNLKKAYTSTHQPGTTPITEEFVVTP